MDAKQLAAIKERAAGKRDYSQTQRVDRDIKALVTEVERLQATLASEQAEARNEIDALMNRLVNVSEDKETLARDLIRTKGEVASLRLQVKSAQDMADELAGLVCRFINTFSAIRHRVGDDVRAVIDAAMKGVDVPDGSGSEPMPKQKAEIAAEVAVYQIRAEAWKRVAKSYRKILINEDKWSAGELPIIRRVWERITKTAREE